MSNASTASTAEVRQWALENGIAVGDRGRLAPDLHAAFALTRRASPQDAKAAAVTVEEVLHDGPAAGSRTAGVRVSASPRPGSAGVTRRVKARSD